MYYVYDKNGILSKASFPDVPGFGVQIPANGLELDEELVDEAGFVWLYQQGKPVQVADNRGVYYSTETGEQVDFLEFGDIPENLTKKAPASSFDKWDGKAWVKDQQAETEALKSQVTAEKEIRLAIATDKINPLQDAVDLDMATDQEKTSLTEWKKYRVLLNRIESQPNYPQQIDWPEQPDK